MGCSPGTTEVDRFDESGLGGLLAPLQDMDIETES